MLPLISIIVPAYNEAENIRTVILRISAAIAPLDRCEIIIVDDGSCDNTLSEIKAIASIDPRLRFLSFTRNFGHQAALKAGLDAAQGACVITLDADLQHPPELIPQMLERWRAGYLVVNMVRRRERSGFLKKATSRAFYALTNAISDVRIEPGSSDFRLLDRRVVIALRDVTEQGLFLRGLIPWLGYRGCSIPYDVADRHAGASKYGVVKMIGFAIRGVTTSTIRPLRAATLFGTGVLSVTLLYAAYALYVKLVAGTAMSGWSSVIISVLVLGSIQLLMLGIIGEYLGRVLREVLNRPPYVINESSIIGSRSSAPPQTQGRETQESGKSRADQSTLEVPQPVDRSGRA